MNALYEERLRQKNSLIAILAEDLQDFQRIIDTQKFEILKLNNLLVNQGKGMKVTRNCHQSLTFVTNMTVSGSFIPTRNSNSNSRAAIGKVRCDQATKCVPSSATLVYAWSSFQFTTNGPLPRRRSFLWINFWKSQLGCSVNSNNSFEVAIPASQIVHVLARNNPNKSFNSPRPNFRTECGQCQSLAWKSSKMKEDLETNKVLLAEKDDQIADLLAGNDCSNS